MIVVILSENLIERMVESRKKYCVDVKKYANKEIEIVYLTKNTFPQNTFCSNSVVSSRDGARVVVLGFF